MRDKKVCSKCNKEKLYIEFGKNKKRSDGCQSWCKKCNTEYLTNWYDENKLPHREEIRRRKKAYKTQVHEFLIDYLLDHPCVDCEEDDPVVLEFDHRDPNEKRFSIGTLITQVSGVDYTLLRTEMDKCDIRCANCHRRKTAKERNYKRYKLALEMKLIDY